MFEMNTIGKARKDFRSRLDYLLHPSRRIEMADQLKGRKKLSMKCLMLLKRLVRTRSSGGHAA